MSFPRYPEYKDSGVEWLGEVPAHWEVSPLKYFARVGNGSTPNREQPGYWTEGTYPWLNSSAVNQDTITESEQFVTQLALDECHLPKILPPAVLIGITGQGRTRGMASTLMIEATISQHIAYVQPNSEKASVGWLRRVIDANYQLLRDESEAGGSTKGAITCEQIAALKFPLPPVLEQTSITAFLDRETAKIDALVSEQERLIELLKEKRQAVISHAVTKGLNPDVPMKPSGVDWLGEVPAHWGVTSIKRFATLQRGYDLTDAERTEGGYPVVTSGGIAGTHGSFMARGPGVVTGRYGSTGKLFFIKGDFWPHNTALYVSEFHGNHPRFVWYSLQTVDFAAHSAKAAVPGIDRNDIHVLPAAVPPLDEQRDIVAHLDRATAKMDALITEAQRAIDLLQERRAALISAAVTGKIDVRAIAKRSAA
jgi:type I restriction enzyme S subunit